MHLEATMTAQRTNQQTVMRVDRKVTQYKNNRWGILHDFHPCIFICLLGGKKLIGPLHYSLIPFYNFTTRSCCFLDRLDRQKPLVYANYFKLTNSLGNGHSYEVKVLLTWRCRLKIHTQLHILLKFYILCEQLFYGLRTRILRDEKTLRVFFAKNFRTSFEQTIQNSPSKRRDLTKNSPLCGYRRTFVREQTSHKI